MFNKMVFSDFTIQDSNIYGGVKYECSCNSDEDLKVGTVASAQIEFVTDLLDANSVGTSFTYYHIDESSAFGVFTIYEATKDNYGRYKITAYDNVRKTDDYYVDDMIASAGNTIGSLLTYIVGQCGLTIQFSASSSVNTTMPFDYTKISVKNTTVRQMLAYIAEVCGCYIFANTNGNLIMFPYQGTVGYTLTPAIYKSIEVSDYTIPAIDKLVVQQSDDDAVPVTSGTGTENNYIITYNPLFYSTGQTSIQTYVDALYTKLNSIGSYVPCKVDLFNVLNSTNYYNIRVGLPLRATLKDNTTIKFWLFSKSFDNSGLNFECTGNKTRTLAKQSLESSVLNMGTKYHTIKNTVDEHTQEIGDAQGDISTLQQTATQISARVTTVEGDLDDETTRATSAELTLSNRITSEVTNRQEGDDALGTRITQTAESLTTTITGVDNKYSTTKQTVDGWSVSGSSGETLINGANIKTGTIVADSIAANTITAGKINGVNASTIISTSTNACTKLYASEEIGTPTVTMVSGGTDTRLTELNTFGFQTTDSQGSSSLIDWFEVAELVDVAVNESTTNGYVLSRDTSSTSNLKWVAQTGSGSMTYPYISNATSTDGVLTLTKQTSASTSTTVTYQAVFG